jgi:acetolactate synthase-1/2/3 large subunit
MTAHQTVKTTETAVEIMTGAEMVVRALVDQGVSDIFGYPGGAVLPIYDALFHEPRLHHVLVRHEQGATHAAEGYARSTGKPGVVLVTSGPGATNAVTGIVDALMDSIPLVVITGQVPTHLIGTDAFQECDTVGITRPCTKHNYLVKNVADLPHVLHEAFKIATTGRPGPVVIALSEEMQKIRVEVDDIPRAEIARPHPDPAAIARMQAMIAAARKPLAILGGSCWSEAGRADIRDFLVAHEIPVAVAFRSIRMSATSASAPTRPSSPRQRRRISCWPSARGCRRR